MRTLGIFLIGSFIASNALPANSPTSYASSHLVDISPLSPQSWEVRVNLNALSSSWESDPGAPSGMGDRFVHWLELPYPAQIHISGNQNFLSNGRNPETLGSDGKSLPETSPSWILTGKTLSMRGRHFTPLIIDLTRLNGEEKTKISELSAVVTLTAHSLPFHLLTPPLHSAPFWSEFIAHLAPTITPLTPPRRDQGGEHRGTILILYPQELQDNAALASLSQFSLWKQRFGYRVLLRSLSTHQSTPQQIKEVIRGFYQQEGIDMVILVGTDLRYHHFPRHPQLHFPSYTLNSEVIDNPDPIEDDTLFYNSDLWYGLLDDDEADLIPEVIIARLMAPTPESLRGMITRILEYERNPYIWADNGEWLTRAIALSDYADPGARVNDGDREFVYWMAYALQRAGFAQVNTIVGSRDDETAARVSQALEQDGLSFLLCNGYLWGTINPDELGAYAFTGRRYPFLVGLANHYGAPMLYPYFANVNPDQLTGPVGALGLFNYAHIAQRPYPFLRGVASGLAYRELNTPAELYLSSLWENASHLALAEAFGFDDPQGIRESSLLFRILGDPTLELRRRLPISLRSELPESLPLGAQSFSLSVHDSAENPIRNAWVTIGQLNRFFLHTRTDESGWARFTIPQGLEEGNLMITASYPDAIPLNTNIPVELLDVNLIIIDAGLDDSEGGNGDGQLQNGESARLNLIFSNEGEQEARNITAHIYTDLPFITVQPQQVPLDNIPSGDTGGLAEVVRVTADPITPGGTRVRLQIDLSNQQEAAFEFITSGPNISWSGQANPGNLARGRQGTLSPTLINLGDMPTDGNLTTQLISLHPHITVQEAIRIYSALQPNQESQPETPFVIRLDSLFIPGQNANFELHYEDRGGFRGAVRVAVVVGESSPSDPIGPDPYGYYAFDSGDTTWPEHPRYRWREINYDMGNAEVRGERLDFGELGISGGSVLLSLPFTFRYYGREFDSLVVCSNGWVSFDTSALRYTSPQYQPIEGGGGPNAQLVPLWRPITLPQSPFWGVFTAFLEEEHIFVVEWSNLIAFQGETPHPVHFQILLYDPEHYPTSTGDGEIVFQYRQFPELPGNQAYPQYALIGIRNLDGSGGIQYSAWNQYHPQANPVQDEFAIKFTTDLLTPRGSIRGQVVLASDPRVGLQGVRIFHPQGIEGRTGEGGFFTIPNVRASRYQGVLFSLPGYTPIRRNITVLPGQETVVGQVSLPRPQLSVNPDRIVVNLSPQGEYRSQQSIILSNRGDGAIVVRARLTDTIGREETIVPLYSLPISQLLGNVGGVYGLVWVDTLFYIPHQVPNNPHRITELSLSGQVIGFFDQPLPFESPQGIRNLTWDGRWLWGTCLNALNQPTIVALTRDGRLVTDFSFPLEAPGTTMAIAYSPPRRNLFIADEGTHLIEITRDGEIVEDWWIRMPGEIFTPCGMTWNSYDPDGMPLYILERQRIQDDTIHLRLLKFSPERGEFKLLGTLPTPPEINGGWGLTLVNTHDHPQLRVAYIEDRGVQDRLYLTALGPQWEFLTQPFPYQEIRVNPNSSQTITLTFQATGWRQGIYPFSLRILTDVNPDTLLIPITLVVDTAAGASSPSPLPQRWGIMALYPNPFNQTLQIQFYLPPHIQGDLTIYDLTGKELMRVWEGYSRGLHNQTIDLNHLPSGLFILRLSSKSQKWEQKIVHLK